MTEPKYDEDSVTLGYLKKILNNEIVSEKSTSISKVYSTQPKPPYSKGDIWIDGNNVYVCINSRKVGYFSLSDWSTESGAKQEAENKNRIYLTQPSNYNAGDMWILQTDNDHKAGKKGEILITTAGRATYNEDDWINMLGYGTIASVNEVAGNLNNAINRIGNVEEAIEDGIIITFYQNSVPGAKHIGDLWYVTDTVEDYIKGKLYRYDGDKWLLLDDPSIEEAFAKANEARIVADGKIQSFYSETEPTENMGIGDLWIDIANNNQLYRYNGTNWAAVYDTRVNQLVTDMETITERTVEISTDLGYIQQNVSETTTKLNNVEETQKTLKTQMEQNTSEFNFRFSEVTETTENNTTAIEEFLKYIRFVNGNIILGETGNEYELKIENDQINIYYNGYNLSSWVRDQFKATDAEFTKSLKLGNFAFTPRSNGNLSFKKISN